MTERVNKMKKTMIATAALAAAALALTACSSGGSGESGGEGATETVPLNLGNFLDVTSWDPALADIGFDGPYLSAVYDPLVVDDGKGGQDPALATDWEFSEDRKTLTMNLRTDAVFSDGEAFNADAAVASLEYLKQGVRSQEGYQKVESFSAVDEDTIEIKLTERDDTILYFMGLGRSYMMSPKAIEAGTLADAPVGSGPYTLSDSSVAGSEYRFDRVEDHWDAAEFPFDPLVISPLSDPTAMLNGMQGGQFNVIYGDDAGIEMAEESGWNVSSGVATWVGLQLTDRLGETEMGKPFGDVRVRQALNYAFDGGEMLKAIGRGNGAATNQVFPDGTPGNMPELNDRYKTNIAKAKELLAEAGYADGFSLRMPMAPPFQPYQAAVEQVFGELNIAVEWDDFQFMDYMEKSSTYPLSITVIAMDGNPVATIERQFVLPQWFSPIPAVEGLPELQAQADRVFAAEPGDAQLAEIEKFNEMSLDEALAVVWYQSNNSYISTKEFTVTPVIGMMFPTLRHIEVVS